MKENTYKFIFIWRAILICFVAGFLGYVLQKNIPFDGARELTYSFGEPKGEIAHLRPFARVTREQGRGTRGEQILEDPVYLDVYSFIPFKKANVRVWYSNSTENDFSIGVQKRVHADQVLMKPFESLAQEGKWSVGTVSYDLEDIPLMRGGYIFVFSAPGLIRDGIDNGTLRVSRIHLTLEREPLFDFFSELIR